MDNKWSDHRSAVKLQSLKRQQAPGMIVKLSIRSPSTVPTWSNIMETWKNVLSGQEHRYQLRKWPVQKHEDLQPLPAYDFEESSGKYNFHLEQCHFELEECPARSGTTIPILILISYLRNNIGSSKSI
jgi:hypothetical protein